MGRRFFCENCGAEVKERDELCSSCGAIFVAIKCPRCGYRGKQHQFANGCPRCGYLADTFRIDTRSTVASESSDTGSDTVRRYARERPPMPAWVFWVVLGALAASFAVLARLYARM